MLRQILEDMPLQSKTDTFLKGVSITTVFTIATGVLGIVYFAVMSRLLSKADFGYFAALTGVMTVISSIADAGLGAAIIQKKDADKAFISTAFTMNFLLGLSCFLIVFFGAPLLARLVADDYLTTPIRVMSVTLLFNSFTSVANAQLYRKLQFKRIGTISFLSNIFNTALSVALAIKGFGLYAMIAYATFGPFLTMILLYTTSAKVPKLGIQKGYVKGIFSFGGWLTLSVICNKIATYIDRLVLPKMTSVETLGAYTRPASFTSNLTGALTDIMDKVLFPMLSDIQDNRQAAINIFYRATELLNAFSAILGCILFFNAEMIITLFFGKEWLDLVPVMRVVSLTSVFFIDTQLVDCFFRSLNFVKTGFFIRLFALFWNLFCIYWGAKYGVMGIAASLAFANISVIILKMLVLNKKLGARKRIMFAKWISSWKVAILPIAIGSIYLLLIPQTSVLTDILFAIIFGGVILYEFLFRPSLVGMEYTNTLYPIIKKKL